MSVGVREMIMAAALSWVFAGEAAAHVVLSPNSAESGSTFPASFSVGHGCDGSPTVLLSLQVPDDVDVVSVSAKAGWKVTMAPAGGASKKPGHISTITWEGLLDAKVKDSFEVVLKLPAKLGPIYFPALQRCQKGEENWNEIGRDTAPIPAHPAPVLQVVAVGAPKPVAAAEHYMVGDIMIMQPWSPATPPGAPTAAGYLTITNSGKTADTLMGAATGAAAGVEIHQMSMDGGIMRMRQVKSIDIPAGKTVTIDPNGYHLMLVGLKAPLKTGAKVPVTLTFAKAGSIEVQFDVAPIGARAPANAPAAPAAMPNMPGTDHH